MPGLPGPDGRHDDLDADQLEGLALLVPDDPRSLDADRDAYLQELRAKRTAQRYEKGLLGRVRRSGGGLLRGGVGLTGPLMLVLLVVVGLVGSTLSVFGSGSTDDRQQTPLASPPADQPVGSVGGLLPQATLTSRENTFPLREARPAVLVLVPTSCTSCGDVLRNLRMQAAGYTLPLLLVGPPAQLQQLRDLDDQELGASVTVATDDSDILAPTYLPSGVTAILVRDDGVVAMVARDLQGTSRLESQLVQLDSRAAPVT
jgi:hypothetical protein